MGPRKRSSAISRAVRLLPTKRSSSAPGNRVSSAGGMKLARAICQKGVAVKASRHHVRHRSTVGRSTWMSAVSRRMRDAVAPSRRIAITTIVAARYTLRPRKRNDGGVLRLRQPCRAQHRLSRKSCSGASLRSLPLGLRG
jgi:hypothetical protein